jgi:hypothetical protein
MVIPRRVSGCHPFAFNGRSPRPDARRCGRKNNDPAKLSHPKMSATIDDVTARCNAAGAAAKPHE